MTFPDRIDARWIEGLTDPQLQQAELELRTTFAKHELAEKKLRGDHYALLRGPESLTLAWMRWSMVSSAVRKRGLRVRHKR